MKHSLNNFLVRLEDVQVTTLALQNQNKLEALSSQASMLDMQARLLQQAEAALQEERTSCLAPPYDQAELRSQLAELNADLTHMAAKQQAAFEAARQWESRYYQAEAALRQLNGEHTGAKADLAHATAKQQAALDAARQWELQHSQAEAALRQLKGQHTGDAGKLRQIRANVSSMKADAQRLKAENDRLREEAQEPRRAVHENKVCCKAVKQLKNESDALRNANRGLSMTSRTTDQQLKVLSASVKRLKKENDALGRENRMLRKTLKHGAKHDVGSTRGKRRPHGWGHKSLPEIVYEMMSD